MRCWLVERITDAGEMAWVERPDPVPGPDEYVVRVEAAGVNFAETLMVRGLYQRNPETPFSPGIEVAGAIGAAGDKTAEKPGRLICADYIGRMRGNPKRLGALRFANTARRATTQEPKGCTETSPRFRKTKVSTKDVPECTSPNVIPLRWTVAVTAVQSSR